MYAANLKTRDKSSAGLAALAIQAGLIVAFLNLAGSPQTSDTQVPMPLVDVSTPTPPPPRVEPQSSRPRQKGGAAAPKNIVSRATAVVSPRPVVQTPVIKTIPAAAIPREATDPTQGAARVRGPGTGLGGNGNGSGSGSGEGNGRGSGDGGIAAEPPRLASPVLNGYDFPPAIIEQWPRAATVFLRLRIDARGYVSECLVDRGTNVPAIDSAMCNTAHERLRFRPALDRSGQAVAGWFGYAQPAPR
jgi:protein TonB